VVPVPVVQIMDAKNLDIKRSDGLASHQMLLNYCFGHDESSILMCPITNARSVNHCSERMDFGGDCGTKVGPNAKIQWGSGWDQKSQQWQNMSFKDLDNAVKKGYRGLSFEIIATRDIKVGEEVFIDYGSAWEEAWKNHIKSWQPPEEGDKYFNYYPVKKLTRDRDIRTVLELATKPYAENVQVTCLYSRPLDKEPKSTLPSNWKELSDAEIIQLHSKPGEYHDKSDDKCTTKSMTYWTYEPCKIYFNNNNFLFTVGIFPDENSPPLVFTEYPGSSIKFSSKIYSSDQHLPNAFRHPIGFPDDLFPTQWKNLREV